MIFIPTFVLSFVLAAALLPLMIRISQKLKLTDLPNQRKIHVDYVSRLGGVAIFISIITALLATNLFMPTAFTFDHFWRDILLGGMAAFLLGLWDDLKDMSPKKKLLLQLALGAVAYRMGFRIEELHFGIDSTIQLGWFALPVTVFWVATIMNAFNMIDGLDGLAGGFALLVFTTLSILGYLNGSSHIMMLSLVCAGACAGFLMFNFHPAKIFMGDCGSMMLGYLLALLSISMEPRAGVVNVYMPLFLLAFPLIDLMTAIIRRIIQAKWTEKDLSLWGIIKKTFHADGNHIHHRLLKLGFTQRKISMFVYIFTTASCVLGLMSVYLPAGIVFFLFIFYLWFTVQCVRLLDYEEFVTGKFRDQKKIFEEKQKLSTAPSLIKKVT